MNKFFKDRNILVTGGAGSFGKLIVKRLLSDDPKVVRVFSRDESKHFEMRQELAATNGNGRQKSLPPNLRYFVGDIRDRERLQRAMENVDVVYHAAGLKHVLSCEYNPFEAVMTNIIGTQNVIDTAMNVKASKVIFTSTDKAVNPCNTMGASKLMGERLISAANQYRGPRRTIFSSVRFGNVLGSRGSVVPHFIKQIRDERRITVTDPEMTRFVMRPGDAVELVLKATELAKGGEIFILKMPALKVGDLAEALVDEYCRREGIAASEVKVEIIGALAGEKKYEALLTDIEYERAIELPDMLVVRPPLSERIDADYSYPDSSLPSDNRFNCDDVPLMSKDEIREMLVDCGAFGEKNKNDKMPDNRGSRIHRTMVGQGTN